MRIMRSNRVLALAVSGALCLALAGCGGATTIDQNSSSGEETADRGTQLAESTPEESLELLELNWSGYTMRFEYISDEIASPINSEIEGKELKVCFGFVSDEAGGEGFNYAVISDALQESPITLIGSDGTVYEWTGAVGDLNFTMGSSSNIEVEENQPLFSIFFDVPSNSTVEDFTIDFGNGLRSFLVPYQSDTYASESE